MNGLMTTRDITKLTGYKKPTVFGLVNERQFPPPFATIGARLRVWREVDVKAWWKGRQRRRRKAA